MTESVAYNSRTAPQEVDAISVCPAHPDYMVYATYTLVKSSEPRDYEAQIRKGSIKIAPIDGIVKPTFPGQLAPYCGTRAFPCGVYDLAFHPDDPTLLVSAMSNGSIHLFRFIKHGDILGRRVICKLLPLGHCTVAEKDEHGLVPLITCVRWLSSTVLEGSKGLNSTVTGSVLITTSFGDIKYAQVTVPDIRDLFDARLHEDAPLLLPTTTLVHTHDLEAWCVTHVNLSPTHSIILSGGDDSIFQASLFTHHVEQPEEGTHSPESTFVPLWSDRRNHAAGVTALLPLTTLTSAHRAPSNHLLVLTGSYDESLRLFSLSRTYPHRTTLLASLDLGGGVFNISLLTSPNCWNSTQDILVLCSCMHAGAKIVRLTVTPQTVIREQAGDQEWSMNIEYEFEDGHTDIVYACDGRKENEEAGQKTYKIVSTSFYDMKICTWEWADQKA